MIFQFLVWAMLTVLTLPAQPQEPSFRAGVISKVVPVHGPYNWRGAKSHALLMTVWYPIPGNARVQPQWIGNPASPFASAGAAGPDAEWVTAPVRFPLILLSHGTGGSALMLAWLGTALAEHGYVAAAVNHPGNNALEPYTPQGFSLWWERATDLSRTLDHLLADPVFANRIDSRRVGAAGFSLGGFSVIQLAGGIGTRSEFLKFCASPAADEICREQLEFPDLREKLQSVEQDEDYQASLRTANRSRRDKRIRAVVAIAPALGPAFRRDNLRSIRLPVLIVAGSADRVVPVESSARYFANQIRDARSKVFDGGVAHYTFLATCTDLGKRVQPVLCGDAPGVDRSLIHAQTATAAVRFFDEHLSLRQ